MLAATQGSRPHHSPKQIHSTQRQLEQDSWLHPTPNLRQPEARGKRWREQSLAPRCRRPTMRDCKSSTEHIECSRYVDRERPRQRTFADSGEDFREIVRPPLNSPARYSPLTAILALPIPRGTRRDTPSPS